VSESRPPAEGDINLYDSLDERVAVANFLGKTVADAARLIASNPMRYQEDLMWMGPAAFNYYIDAVDDYVCGPQAAGQSDFIDALAAVLEFRLKHDGSEIDGAKVGRLVDHILDRYSDYEIESPAHPDLEGRYRRLRQLARGPRAA